MISGCKGLRDGFLPPLLSPGWWSCDRLYAAFGGDALVNDLVDEGLDAFFGDLGDEGGGPRDPDAWDQVLWGDITAGGDQYYQSGNLGGALTTTVSGLPTDGSTIYATLYSLIGGQWTSNAYSYTALNATGGLATIQTPTPGTTLSGTAATFTWSTDSNATAYWLDIGTEAGGDEYYQSGNLGNVTTTSVNNLPANGSTIYATLYSYVGGQWLSNSVTYVSGP